MSSRRGACAVVALVVMLLATRAAAEPAPTPAAPPAAEGAQFFHVPDEFTLTLKSGRAVPMPPAYILPQPAFDAIDAEMRRLQESETRLTAERDSLVTSANEAGPGWGTVALVLGAFAAGTATAYAVYH